jgi:hypothetical protein
MIARGSLYPASVSVSYNRIFRRARVNERVNMNFGLTRFARLAYTSATSNLPTRVTDFINGMSARFGVRGKFDRLTGKIVGEMGKCSARPAF